MHDAEDGGGLEWLLEHRQRLQLLLEADAFDVFEHRRAAAAHELHVAEKAAFAERMQGMDRFRGFKPDVEKDEVRPALLDGLAEGDGVAEFLGIDPGAVQDERQEVPDRGLVVDHEAERQPGPVRSPPGARCRVGDCAVRLWLAIEEVYHIAACKLSPSRAAVRQ